MTGDAVATGMRRLADAWEQQAAERESHAPGVPDAVAATLRTRAAELRARVAEIERETAYLTVAEYAAETGQSEATVRRLCGNKRLWGAVKDDSGDWRIPRGAKRVIPSTMAQAS